MSAWIETEHFRIGTPVQAPKSFRGYIWLASRVECKKCGRSHTQALRIHQIQLPSFESGNAGIIHKLMPSDEKIASTFALKVEDNGVGCYRTCRPWRHMKVCLCPGECACPRSTHCVCPTGCGNKGIYPCRCGRAFGINHMPGCETGLIKRVSSYAVDAMRSQMARGRR